MRREYLPDNVGADAAWDYIVAHGWMVSLSTTTHTVLISAFSLALAFLVRRLFRAWGVLVFFLFLPESRLERRTDQMRVAIVNMRTPATALLESVGWRALFRNRNDKLVALTWLLGVVVCALLGLASPFWMTLFPVASGTIEDISSCAYSAKLDNASENDQEAFSRLLNDYETQNALGTTDMVGYDYSGASIADIGHMGPSDRVAKLNSCPSFASACTDGEALHFHGEYWITPADMGIGNVKDIQFGVETQCYKVTEAQVFLGFDAPSSSPFSYRRYGLMYGGRAGDENVHPQNHTVRLYREESFGRGYFIESEVHYEDDNDPSFAGKWLPREDLVHSGDTSLLIYHIGATIALDLVDDPMFRTVPLNVTNVEAEKWEDENLEKTESVLDGPVFRPASQTVTVVCNTTYHICDKLTTSHLANGCNRVGGSIQLENFFLSAYWAQNETMDAARIGFVDLINFIVSRPGMQLSSGISNSVLASLDLDYGEKTQMNIKQAKGHKELTRLFLATRTRLLLAAQRATAAHLSFGTTAQKMGYRSEDVVGKITPGIEKLCAATLIRTPDYRITSAKPWVVVAVIWLSLVLMTYSAPLLIRLRWKQVTEATSRWRRREAGYLHARLVEPSLVAGNTLGEQNLDTWPRLGKGNISRVDDRVE
ncbi:hypothetical protein BKA64DRAFT_686827 [Cadophora sp. MPI-SDFR-AT-0126]|nr:hypothetical protein BKA64DRAFT_686827 [Leotiomycetes sp. MPI-SDFR-AT-0126]